MRTLALLILSSLLVTGCGGSGGGSGDSATSSGNTGSGSAVSGDGGFDNSTDTNTSNSGSTAGNSGSTESGDSASNGDFAEQMLAAVNAARAEARDCGGQMMPAVPALTWDYSLEQAAFVHSSNMANYNFFDHTGLNGDSPSDRVTDQGYSWSATGENIAAGQQSIAEVMDGWLKSPGHCKNIMSANFTQMGASSVTNSSSQYGIYWTQVFARPR